MLSFTGWDLYGNMCCSIRMQGINILINMFYGVAYNATSSVANSVKGIISNLSTNVIQAFRPQIVKTYSQSDITEMGILMSNALKYSMLLFLLIAVPLAFEIETLIDLWLGLVPQSAPSFCIAMIGISMLALINNILGIAISATGNMKRISFLSGSIYLLAIPIIYIAFEYIVHSAIYAYIVSCGIHLIVVFANFIIVKKQIPTINIKLIIGSTLEAISIAFVAIIPILILIQLHLNSIIELLMVSAIYALTLFGITIMVDKKIRAVVVEKLKQIF